MQSLREMPSTGQCRLRATTCTSVDLWNERTMQHVWPPERPADVTKGFVDHI